MAIGKLAALAGSKLLSKATGGGGDSGGDGEDGLNFLQKAGMGMAAGGALAGAVSGSKSADNEADIIKQNQANESEAMRKEQRANIGKMLAQGAGSGVGLSSFQDLFNNQTIEDGIQNAQSKQAANNLLAQTKNKKKSSLVGGITSLGSQAVTLGSMMKED